MHAIKYAPLFAVLASLVACTRETTNTPPASLEGDWQWVQSDGGIANNIHNTPASTGKSLVLKLTAGGEYVYYTNGVENTRGTYTLETRTCIHDQREKTFIQFSACPGQMVEALNGTTLTLSDEAFDGVSSTYHKTEATAH